MGLMDIMNGFRGVKTAAAAVATPTAPAVDPSKSNPTVPGDSTVKSNGSVAAIPPAGEGTASPLEGFKDLWKDDPNAKKPASLEVNFPVDPVKMMEAARKVDFSKAISPETLALIERGDKAGFLAGLNEVAQAAFAQASGATVKVVEAALNKQAKVFNEEVLPDALKKHAVASSLRTENPVFLDPAVSPLLTIVEERFQRQFPTASAQEITTKAREYLMTSSEVILGTSKDKVVSTRVAETGTGNSLRREPEDWGKFFGESA